MLKHRLDVPFNIELMKLDKERLRSLKETTSLAIFDGASREFDTKGLFSNEIYSEVGSRTRDTTFSYIALKTTIFHPKVFQVLHKLKKIYSEIITGKTFAVWDEKTSDFIKSNPVDGDTGFHFFVKHWESIKFRESNSAIRKKNIALIKKYKERALTAYILILPAGLRDIEIVEGGRVSDDPVNDFYRSIIMANNIMPDRNNQDRSVNQARTATMVAYIQLFEYFLDFISGKTGYLLRHYATRSIADGTRNVIVAMNLKTDHLDSPRTLSINDSTVGIYQHAMSIRPVTLYFLKTFILDKVFGTDDGYVFAVNRKTLRGEYTTIPSEIVDTWSSKEGLNKIINRMDEKDLRHKPITLGPDHYLALIYLGDDMSFKVIHSIDSLPDHLDKSKVMPLTLIQLIYLCGYREWEDFPSYMTRYPILTSGSIFCTRVKVKTTVKSEVRKELNDDFEPYGETHVAVEFPLHDYKEFVDAMSPNFTRIDEQGADFDGDKESFNSVMTEEAKNEAKLSWHQAKTYLTNEGHLRTSFGSGSMAFLANLLTHNLTRTKP